MKINLRERLTIHQCVIRSQLPFLGWVQQIFDLFKCTYTSCKISYIFIFITGHLSQGSFSNMWFVFSTSQNAGHQIHCIYGKCLILCPCTDLSVSAFLHTHIYIYIYIYFSLLVFFPNLYLFISQRSSYLWLEKNIPPHSAQTQQTNIYTVSFTHSHCVFLWVRVGEQRGSGSVAVNRSLKMLLGVITSDCNQNSFKWTTVAQMEWFHQRNQISFKIMTFSVPTSAWH